MLDRLEIRSGRLSPTFHSSVKPFTRQSIAAFADSFPISGNPISFHDFVQLGYLQADNPMWSSSEKGNRAPLFGIFYPKNSAMFAHFSKRFEFVLNPVSWGEFGNDLAQEENIYRYARGFSLRAKIGEKVGVYSYLTENGLYAPSYVRDYTGETGVFPGAGLTKITDNGAYDFFQARGYITFNPIEEINLQFGHDRNFIGDGIRSFILSDFGKENLFFKINTKVWKFNYQNLFMELSDRNAGGSDKLFNQKKYVASHHLSINILKNLQVGVFETIVFDRTDTNGVNGGFEANYLNPVIFYRSVEHGLNSSDNAMLGVNWKWNFLERFSLYGQFVLDEFKFDEMFGGEQWWANKYAVQTGIKYVDAFFVSNLDFQAEFNLARPYIFQHRKFSQNFTHFRTPLGHPLGANFHETLFQLRYRMMKKLFIEFTYINYLKGTDADGLNWGGDVRNKDYESRVRDYGNYIGQGVNTRVQLFEWRNSWMLFHNTWVDLSYRYRDEVTELNTRKVNSFLSLGIRLNIARQPLYF